MCYYFDYTMGIIDINFRNILLDQKKKKKEKKTFIQKYFMGSIQLHIRFDEIDGFIKIYNGMRYLVIYMMKFVIGSNIL